MRTEIRPPFESGQRRRLVTIRTAVERRQYDPPYDEWVALPEAEPLQEIDAAYPHHFVCPGCGGTYFGTRNPMGFLLVRLCYGDADRPTCGTRYRTPPTEVNAIESIFAFLCNFETSYWSGWAE